MRKIFALDETTPTPLNVTNNEVKCVFNKSSKGNWTSTFTGGSGFYDYAAIDISREKVISTINGFNTLTGQRIELGDFQKSHKWTDITSNSWYVAVKDSDGTVAVENIVVNVNCDCEGWLRNVARLTSRRSELHREIDGIRNELVYRNKHDQLSRFISLDDALNNCTEAITEEKAWIAFQEEKQKVLKGFAQGVYDALQKSIGLKKVDWVGFLAGGCDFSGDSTTFIPKGDLTEDQKNGVSRSLSAVRSSFKTWLKEFKRLGEGFAKYIPIFSVTSVVWFSKFYKLSSLWDICSYVALEVSLLNLDLEIRRTNIQFKENEIYEIKELIKKRKLKLNGLMLQLNTVIQELKKYENLIKKKCGKDAIDELLDLYRPNPWSLDGFKLNSKKVLKPKILKVYNGIKNPCEYVKNQIKNLINSEIKLKMILSEKNSNINLYLQRLQTGKAVFDKIIDQINTFDDRIKIEMNKSSSEEIIYLIKLKELLVENKNDFKKEMQYIKNNMRKILKQTKVLQKSLKDKDKKFKRLDYLNSNNCPRYGTGLP